MRIKQGFTLIELMIVVAIIALLATISIPTFEGRIVRSQVKEALQMAEPLQASINDYYRKHQRFPVDNKAAGVPLPHQLVGNYVKRVNVDKGAIHIELGNRINAKAEGRILTLRPAYVNGSHASPISWLCGYAEPVDGMSEVEGNRTDVSYVHLDPECRSWRGDKSASAEVAAESSEAGG